MSNLPEGAAQFEFQKVQLVTSLHAVAEQMRNCANIAEHFGQMLANVPFSPNGAMPFQPVHAAPPMMQTPAPTKGNKRKAPALDEDGKKIKAEKKYKDPNAPKRPPSSYLLFQNEIRKIIQEQNPKMPNAELLKDISRRWKELTPEQKDVYEQRIKTQKAKYDIDKAAYDLTTPGKVSPVLAVAPVEAKPVKAKSPVVASSSTDEDTSDDGSSEKSSSEESSEEEEEEEEENAQPPPKKAKKAVGSSKASAAAPPPPPPKKQKKARA